MSWSFVRRAALCFFFSVLPCFSLGCGLSNQGVTPYWSFSCGQCGSKSDVSLYHHQGGDVLLSHSGSVGIGGEAKPQAPRQPMPAAPVEILDEECPPSCFQSLRKDVRELRREIRQMRSGMLLLEDILVYQKKGEASANKPQSPASD